MKYRVCYRETAGRAWQVEYFECDRAAAVAFQRSKRRQLWAAFVEAWHEGELRWIG